MKRIPSVMSVMTPFPHWIATDASVADARAMMRERGVSHLPSLRDGRLVGLLRETDLAPSRAGTGATVGELVTSDSYVVDIDDRLDVVVLEMSKRGAESALVTRHGALAGIVTSSNVYRYLAELLREMFRPPSGHDAA